MKIVYIGIFRNQQKPAFELTSAYNNDAFGRFDKEQVIKLMTTLSRTVAERTLPEQRQDVEELNHTLHVFARGEGVAGVVATDAEYPKLAAHSLLSKVLREFLEKYPKTSWEHNDQKLPFDSSLQTYLKEYQDPKKADDLTKIQQELDETKITLHKTIESVLERGEKLDTLLAKSDGLSFQSRMFYKTARKNNSCCTVM